MSTTYHPLNPIRPSSDIYPQPVTALAFDPLSDTLWTGTNSGSIVARYSAQGIRGVSFPVGGDLAVRDIIATDSNVRAYGVSGNGIGAWGKGGVNKWFYQSKNAITAFSNNSPSASVFYACTAAQELLAINSQTGDVLRKNTAMSIYNHLVHAHTLLVSGSSDGVIRTHDMRTSQDVVHTTTAHTSGVQGLQASGNFIFTIGAGLRQGRPFPDPLVKLYDMRTMRPLPPVPFSAGPSFLNRLPNRSSSIVVTSSEGLVNVVDASDPSDSEFYQLATPSYLTSVAVSGTGSYLAFGDSEGTIHLLSAAEDGVTLPLNGFEGQPVEWADTPELLPEVSWSDNTPLNSIGMPYYNSHLLSSWSSKFLPRNMLYPPPPKIPQQILNTMKTNDNVAYAALPKELRGRRNVVVLETKKTSGRFRSGNKFHAVEPSTPDAEYDADVIPKPYRKVEIEYSKFGVEDFDFDYYNNTEYSGLETHILNSYTNPMVQLLHYTHPIRQLAKSHITTDCARENCLFCELGFVSRMLEDAKGVNCQSSNFCKTIGVLAHGVNLIEIVDYGRESTNTNHAHMIQSFHRFLVDNLTSEGNAYPQNPWLIPPPAGTASDPAPAPITQLLGIDAKNVIICTNCHAIREKEQMLHVVDLAYPRKPPSNDSVDGTDFASILRSSIIRHSTHRATCQKCNKQFAIFESRRSIPTKDLPPILAVNAAVYNPESLRFWKDGRNRAFLTPTVEVRGEIMGVEDHQTALYELRGMVVQVAKDKHSHLVAIIKIPEAEQHSGPEESPWYLFNDFRVQNISEEEALSFSGAWKVPSVVYLERVDTHSRIDYSGLPTAVDLSILSQDTNISRTRDPNLVKHELLRYDELPKPGAFVAIDAEFVSMQQEETEYRSDGTKKVLRPARLSLARVSVLRGDGPKEGVPFIDDHIHTSEVIVDYLTEFSGIKFGDLDPLMSQYTLTPLKVVYKKLRLLVDRGCIFVGHGLSKDFRIINIYVPPEQIIDTVDLYFVPSRQRRLSLRFLTWYVLNENIQTDTHDSIEDAMSALRLFKAFQKFESEGIFDQKLEELYREGRQINFKPPQLQDAVSKTPVPQLPQPYPLSAPLDHHPTFSPRSAAPFMMHGMQPNQQQQMFMLQQGLQNMMFGAPPQPHHPPPNWRNR
ncbi:PAB-dependent poly-A-specific ribonuclease subunit PAN2 [Cristinia sonorae]|uniref:PAN2-PAN3 deadenylation complex catalytic subunit PAN2 n=1 Tax=Cristinia sonorae TaxID=1940300 RepID=A0A8K0XS22_9AGAR|nr:PAB-dependent poly-A-specific ribonuclease subunit PAN2 [Cristinia sonorae]